VTSTVIMQGSLQCVDGEWVVQYAYQVEGAGVECQGFEVTVAPEDVTCSPFSLVASATVEAHGGTLDGCDPACYCDGTTAVVFITPGTCGGSGSGSGSGTGTGGGCDSLGSTPLGGTQGVGVTSLTKSVTVANNSMLVVSEGNADGLTVSGATFNGVDMSASEPVAGGPPYPTCSQWFFNNNTGSDITANVVITYPSATTWGAFVAREVSGLSTGTDESVNASVGSSSEPSTHNPNPTTEPCEFSVAAAMMLTPTPFATDGHWVNGYTTAQEEEALVSGVTCRLAEAWLVVPTVGVTVTPARAGDSPPPESWALSVTNFK
jgi:hypothetical protein